MSRLILSTGNIITGGPSIIRRSNGERSNLELLNSLRSNFSAAQDDYSRSHSPPPSTNGYENHTNGTRPRTDTSLWTSTEGDDLYIPRIDWSESGLVEEPSQYDITVKLFYLSNTSTEERAKYTKDAVSLVLKELGAPVIDLLIVSFPNLVFQGDCEYEADRKASALGDDTLEIASWSAIEDLHHTGIVKRLGVSEFGSEKLARFTQKVKVRPSVDQINVKDCCSVPPPLVAYAKKSGIDLLTHNDCTNVLPEGNLRALLGQGEGGAGVLDASGERSGLEGDLKPQWVVKYTAVVRDRGVIENKGYFAAAALA